jgi:PAS domain S-box-containing protein
MSKAINILVVEDSENDTQLLVDELRRHGYEPRHRRVETSEGLHRAIEQREWDVVVSDYTMPQFSGSEALKLFNAFQLDIPFIFVSGTHGEEAAVRMMKAGADDYIVKGNLARLVPAIEREMESARSRHERLRAEAAMHQLAAIVESSEDAIYGMDLDSTITSWNPAAERIYGYAAREIIGRSVAVLFPSNRRDELLGTMAQVRRGDLVGSYDTERRRKDGQIITMHMTSSPIRNAAGKIIAASVIARDISKQKQDEQDCLDLITDLTNALKQAKPAPVTLGVCAECNQVRENKGDWQPVETYLETKLNATLTPDLCPDCSDPVSAAAKQVL